MKALTRAINNLDKIVMTKQRNDLITPFDLYWIKLGFMVVMRDILSIDEDGDLRTMMPIFYNLN